MNERDSEAVAAMLRSRGYEIVDSERDCDSMLLNTCAVRDAAELKAVGKAGYMLRRKESEPRFILGVMGCMAQNRGASLFERLPGLDLLVGTQKFHRVPDYLDRLRERQKGSGQEKAAIVDLDEEEGSQNAIRDHLESERPSAFVSIQQGCNMHCAFCIVPKTRGDERSRPMEEIVDECRMLARRGVKEITLLGQIVTSYGRRLYPSCGGISPFVRLLEQVHEVGGIERIRFTSPHPCGFRDDLVQAFGRLPKLCEYVHLPMQSGCNRILKAMKRPYSKERYQEIVSALRKVRPNMYFSTDIIVGFPGESEADFEETRELFETCNFDMAYIFKYSIRSGTVAADMPEQVPEAEKERRNQILLELLRQNSLRRNAELVGGVQEVLVEGRDKTGTCLIGRTRGNRVVIFEGKERLIGQLVKIKVLRATVSSLYGDLVLSGL